LWRKDKGNKGFTMAHAGQFGAYYAQVVDRFYHALEWRYNELQGKKGHDREQEILAKLLDILLADQVGHDLPLPHVEAALQRFQKVRSTSFTPNKYKEIMELMGIEENATQGYEPKLFGNVTLEVHRTA
jgi:hypothetical protein